MNEPGPADLSSAAPLPDAASPASAAAGSPPPSLEALATGEDLRQLYRAFLGRDPEAQLIKRGGTRPLRGLVREMAASAEVNQQVLHALVQQRPLPHRLLSTEALAALEAWLADRLGLEPAADAAPRSLPALLLALYQLPQVAPHMLLAHGGLHTQALEDLALLVQAGHRDLTGKIEFANREFIAGWLMDRHSGQGQLPLEIRLDGKLIAAGSAHSYRADIHQHHGGDGMVGFRVRWHPGSHPAGRPLELRLHEASTGVPVGLPYKFKNSFVDQLSVGELLAKELEEIKRRLDTLAGMVPQALSYSAFPLEHYDLYRRTHRVPPPPWRVAAEQPGGRKPGWRTAFTVLLDASANDPIAVRQSVDALRNQGWPNWQAWILGGDSLIDQVVALLGAADRRLQRVPDGEALRGLLHRRAAEPDHWAVLLEAGELLNSQALPWLVQTVQRSDALALYWDEDQLEYLGGRLPRRVPRHVNPILRAPFDPDAMLELNVVGTSFAVRVDALEAALGAVAKAPGGDVAEPEAGLALAERERLVWAIALTGPMVHIAQPLLSRPLAGRAEDSSPDLTRLIARATPQALAPLLPPGWRERNWTRLPDPLLAAQRPGAKPLVHWQATQPQAVISVLIPTRDYGELVRDCVDSLRSFARHPDALEILIADNGSTDPDTLAYLAQAEAAGELRVLRIDEPFNWSRLNNQMAAAARGPLLLFLNNDTRMLTRHWDDLLRGYLSRPEVRAVGARLLYEDMTLQHAGVVFGTEDFVAHEHMGAAVDAPDNLLNTQLTRRVQAVTGAFIGCTRETFEAVGGFDETQLTVTFNDVQWCLRAQDASAAACILYAPAISLIHLESKSRGFDFEDLDKQRRANYERDALEARWRPQMTAAIRLHPALSRWTSAGTALR
ncbi:glycosyltransferase [Ideonella azotifigens]|uniref:Glycosyltransferase 2-like domain-containing protein n=3 Tax=Ideonella azotifigens TaxID=513160 RepID=A0ABP3USV6_9BURK|nr:glycosyltransferase [Ideonella azotifigens]MCD2339653.1 glycosyltransferase [Ideonella azotifigens]